MNTTELLESLKRHVLYPASSIKYSDPDLVKILNEQMLWAVQTEFTAMNEDYFVTKTDIPLVAGKASYITPALASCWSYDAVMYVDGDGAEKRLPRWSIKMEGINPVTNGNPSGIILEDAFLKLYPGVTTSPVGSLRVYYRRILNELTEIGNCGNVTFVGDGGTTWDLTLDALPVGYTSGLDVIDGVNPYEIFLNAQIPSVVGTTISFLKTLFDRTPVVGDFVAPTGKTPVPHIPKEWHSLISVCAAVSILASNGNQAQYALKKGERDEMVAQLRRVNSRRINSAPKKIVNRNYILNSMRTRNRW